MSDDQTVVDAKGFFSSIYSKIVAEAKALEPNVVAAEALVKAKIEAFAAGVSAALNSLHADATKVEAEVKDDVEKV